MILFIPLRYVFQAKWTTLDDIETITSKITLLNPKVIHHLTTTYYNSLYLTPVFIHLYITGLFVMSYSMPYGSSHCRSRPIYSPASSPD